MVKPSCPANASDSQTEGGGFLLFHMLPSVVSYVTSMRIIAHQNVLVQLLIQRLTAFLLLTYITYMRPKTCYNERMSITPLTQSYIHTFKKTDLLSLTLPQM